MFLFGLETRRRWATGRVMGLPPDTGPRPFATAYSPTDTQRGSVLAQQP